VSSIVSFRWGRAVVFLPTLTGGDGVLPLPDTPLNGFREDARKNVPKIGAGVPREARNQLLLPGPLDDSRFSLFGRPLLDLQRPKLSEHSILPRRTNVILDVILDVVLVFLPRRRRKFLRIVNELVQIVVEDLPEPHLCLQTASIPGSRPNFRIAEDRPTAASTVLGTPFRLHLKRMLPPKPIQVLLLVPVACMLLFGGLDVWYGSEANRLAGNPNTADVCSTYSLPVRCEIGAKADPARRLPRG